MDGEKCASVVQKSHIATVAPRQHGTGSQVVHPSMLLNGLETSISRRTQEIDVSTLY